MGLKKQIIKTIYCVTTKIALEYYSSETNGLSMSIATFNKTAIPLSFNIVMFKASKTASFLDIKPLNLCKKYSFQII
jgi:hypothetical protein